MALIWQDCADYYSVITQVTINWASYGATTLSSGTGRLGGNSFLNTGGGNAPFISKTFNYTISNTVPLNFGFPIKSHENNTAYNQYILKLNTDQGSLILLQGTGGANSLFVNNQLNGSGTTSGTTPVGNGVEHFVQVSILFSTTGTGYIKVYVDGILDINYSGATVSGSLPTNLINFSFIPGNINNNTNEAYVDSFYFWDGSGGVFNAFPLPTLYTSNLTPSGQGDLDQYTPSAGLNYACVNGGFADATYVSDASTGNIDLYRYASLAYIPQNIFAVVGNYYGQNSGGTGTSNLIPKLKTSGITVSGATQVLPSLTNANLQNAFYNDASGSAWTVTNVNNMQLGMGD